MTATEKLQAKKYVLTVLKDGEYQALREEELEKFAKEYPEIAKYWEEP